MQTTGYANVGAPMRADMTHVSIDFLDDTDSTIVLCMPKQSLGVPIPTA
ncbi:hypothetical protein [Paraburkholderia sp. SOS3]|jgi:hypothetical protein|nr:hypothetical protein [Paraburkholderia sp. SOS3]